MATFKSSEEHDSALQDFAKDKLQNLKPDEKFELIWDAMPQRELNEFLDNQIREIGFDSVFGDEFEDGNTPPDDMFGTGITLPRNISRNGARL